MPPVRSGYGGGIVRGKAAVAIPLIRDIGHENYEVFDGSGRAARSDDFGKVAEHHERGRERPSEAIFRTSRELLTAFPASGGRTLLRTREFARLSPALRSATQFRMR